MSRKHEKIELLNIYFYHYMANTLVSVSILKSLYALKFSFSPLLSKWELPKFWLICFIVLARKLSLYGGCFLFWIVRKNMVGAEFVHWLIEIGTIPWRYSVPVRFISFFAANISGKIHEKLKILANTYQMTQMYLIRYKVQIQYERDGFCRKCIYQLDCTADRLSFTTWVLWNVL